EGVARAAVKQRHLPGMIEAGEIEHMLDIRFLGAVEHRSGDRNAMAKIDAELDEALLVKRLDGLVLTVNSLQQLFERLGVPVAIVQVDGVADLQAQTGACPA